MENNIIITIGRQFGTGSLTIAKRIAEELKIKFYDTELLKIAAKESGLSEDCFTKIDEKKELNLIESLFLKFSINVNDLNNDSVLNNDKLFTIKSEIIKKIASEKSCVFVGRCADYILRDYKNKISFFLTSELKDRIKTVSKQQNISEKEAATLIEKSDKKRASYYNYYTNKQWGHANSYDFCLNTSLLGIDKTTDIILNIINSAFH